MLTCATWSMISAQSEPKHRDGTSSASQNPDQATIDMKRVCKNIDITDTELIKRAIQKCLQNKSKNQMRRPDIARVFNEYKTVDVIAERISWEIRTDNIVLPPISWEVRRDKSNGKLRNVGVEDIWQQFYDNLVFIALEELSGRIGEYQCACLRGRGSKWGKDIIAGWMAKGNIRVVHQYDIHHNYASTTRENVMAFLEKHVNNPLLLHVIDLLLQTSEGGLIIGSVLSVLLNALYLSQIYHYIMEDLYRIRKHKDGTEERIRLVEHTIFFVDDFAIYCTSTKNAEMADKRIRKYAASLGLTLHDYIRKTAVSEDTYQDIMGFRIYQDHVTMRHRDYVKVKRALRQVDAHITIKNARKLVSLNGFIKNSDSFRFRKKYHSKRILKKARRYISRYERSKVHREAEGRNDQQAGRSDHSADRGQ